MTEPPAQIEAEGDRNDLDSALGESVASSSVSLTSSILRYRQENGRSYHAYKDGQYIFPNDEAENDRLDLQHHLFMLTYGGKLFLAPISRTKQLNHILDVGTGTGIWAIDVADEHPEASVLGIDLSPIQPSFVPPNVTFQIDDLEETWTFSNNFDFIHARMMNGSFKDWPLFLKQSFDNLVPGGFLEVGSISLPLESDDGTLPTDSALVKWAKLCAEAATQGGRPVDIAQSYKSMVEAAGFIKVVETRFKWPTNGWPKDQKLKEFGLWNYENICVGLEGLTLALLTRYLGWTKQQVEVFLVDVRRDMKNRKIHAWYPVIVVYGQKPE